MLEGPDERLVGRRVPHWDPGDQGGDWAVLTLSARSLILGTWSLSGTSAVVMTSDEKARRLRTMVARLAADCGGDLESLAPPSSMGLSDGFEWATSDEADMACAQSALAKLACDKDAEFGPDDVRIQSRNTDGGSIEASSADGEARRARRRVAVTSTREDDTCS